MKAQTIINEVIKEQEKKYNSEKKLCEIIKKANPSLVKYLDKEKEK